MGYYYKILGQSINQLTTYFGISVDSSNLELPFSSIKIHIPLLVYKIKKKFKQQKFYIKSQMSLCLKVKNQ